MPFGKGKFISQPIVVRYGVATLFAVLASVLTSGLWLIVDRPISAPLFLAAIVASTWLFGLRVGFYTSFICGILIDFYFVQPFHTFTFSEEEILRLILFYGEAGLLSWLVDKLRSATYEIEASREELRELTKYQQTLRESEQKRIALEIHDELGQALTGLKMDVHFLNRQIVSSDLGPSKNVVMNDLDDLSKKIDATIGTVRRISSDLRPSILDDFGLVAASEWQTQQFEQNTEIRCRFATEIEDIDLGPESNTAVFRILQEALTNVVRHADAKSVSVNLSKGDDGVVMTVADDGKGIDLKRLKLRTSLGIVGMRERTRLIGGELDISNAFDGGTVVELRIPPHAESQWN